MSTAAMHLNHSTANLGLPMSNRVSPMASSNSSGNDSKTAEPASAGITANDFLVLLVTEMKNQDPTANTNPNEYINQLVNVNSLQQLISINETLTGAFKSPADAGAQHAARPTPNSNESADRSRPDPVAGSAADPSLPLRSSSISASADADPNVYTILNNMVHGNLSIPAHTPATDRLTHALDGHSNVPLVK